MSQQRWWLPWALLLAVAAGFFLIRPLVSNRSSVLVFEPPSRPVEPRPLTPWREPDLDRAAFFPGSTHYQEETRILSGQRLELEKKLGRTLAADESSLQWFRIFQGERPVGTVLTRNVPGQHGAIELVVALNGDAGIAAVKVQRCREPEPQASSLTQGSWLQSFRGKSASDPLIPGTDLPPAPAGTESSAREMASGIKSLLVLHQTAIAVGLKPHH